MRSAAIAAMLAANFAVAMVAPPAAAIEPNSQTVMVGVRHNMEATLYTPVGAGPFPTILLMHTSGGLQEADREFGARLAKAGYICIVPAFLRAHGITSEELRRKTFTSENRAIYDDFVEIIGELNHLAKAKPGVVGALGFSSGGYFAAWLAATGQVKAGVGYYGAYTGAATDKTLKQFSDGFTSTSAPFLVLHGQKDATVPPEAAKHLDMIMTAARAPHELVVYPDTGHRFDRDFSVSGNKAAADDAWSRSLIFFKAHLQ